MSGHLGEDVGGGAGIASAQVVEAAGQLDLGGLRGEGFGGLQGFAGLIEGLVGVHGEDAQPRGVVVGDPEVGEELRGGVEARQGLAALSGEVRGEAQEEGFDAGFIELSEGFGESRDLGVVAEASDHIGAMRHLRRVEVDLAMVDLTLGGASGMSLVKSISVEWPDVATLVVSMHEEKVYAERVFRAGAHGYVTKDQPWSTLLAAVRQVLAGRLAFSRDVARTLLGRDRDGDYGVAGLSDRELEVFSMLGRGSRIREVAEGLHLSPKTVESHVASIKRKLGITHANEMIYRATIWRLTQRTDDAEPPV